MSKTSLRLLAALDLLDYAHRLADIGTDHGYFPIMAVTTKKAKMALAIDNKAMPLASATFNVTKAQLDNKITIALQDGLENLPVDVDVVSIMGMGGKLISSLLDGANLNLVRRLIIGPNKDHYELRQWLENHSFCIIAERFVRDQGHDYQLIAAVHGQMHLSEIEKQYGPYIIKECSPLFRNHIERQIALLSQALSVTNDLQKRISLLDRITILRELIA